MIENRYKEKLTKLVTTFKEAEKQLKNSEHDTNNISISSINQMRYVAYHLVKSFELQDKNKIIEEIKKATNHAQRAQPFDTTDLANGINGLFELMSIINFVKMLERK